MSGAAPRVDRILETALYVADLAASKEFYVKLLGGNVMLDTSRLVALDVAGTSVLLLFRRGASNEPLSVPGGIVPGHGAQGVQHIAFAVASESLSAWKQRLLDARIAIESEVSWPAGGRSVYVRDPDGHSVELATRGLWPTY